MIQTEDGESRVRVDVVIVGSCSSTTNEEKAGSIESLKTWLSEKETGIPVKVFPTQKELLNEIEKILEVHIMRGFERMYSYMHQYFIRKSLTYNIESTDVLNLDMIVAVVKDTVQDGDLSCRSRKHADTATDSFEIEVMSTICRRMLHAIVSPLAAKYNIPEFQCYQALMELQFEITISKAVSKNTRYRLSKLCHAQTKHNSSSTLSEKVLHEVDISAQSLRTDLQNEDVIKTVDRNFQTAQRVTTMMRKMTFEIKGYLRQSLVSSSILDIETPRPKISDKLRHDILRIETVYGMGTVYEVLEIHLRCKSEKSESDVKNEIAEVMQKHEHRYPYIVRLIDKEPKHFFSQGDKTLSYFPDDRYVFRVGSVGCFVKDHQGKPHLLTCAHAVSPGNKLRHAVQIEKKVKGKLIPHRFGLSTPDKTIYPGDGNFPLVDIAAVSASDDCNIRQSINYNMRDDSGNTKPVSFLCDMSVNLIGTTVYKYGAITHLSHGTIVSTDFCIAENNPDVGAAAKYVMLIDNLPDISDDDKVIEEGVKEELIYSRVVSGVRNFAEPGDSGAIICFNDYSVDHTGSIIAAVMLNAGDYRIKDDSSPKHTGFLLARALEKLNDKGLYLIM